MAENPRIEELRRRVQADPASIAFAALAEEFRRVGRYDDAVATCRTGLLRHPAYLSARVTLGRALIETGDLDAAREELETVLRSAPENLAAIRGLAQIHERLDQSKQMDPQLADMAQTIHTEQLRAAAQPPIPLAPQPQDPVAPKLTPAAPPPDVESLSPDTVSLDQAGSVPLDEAAAPVSTDPFASFAPVAAPARTDDLSFDLANAFAIEPKAAPRAEPAIDLGMAPLAAPVEEMPEESRVETIEAESIEAESLETLPLAGPEPDFDLDLAAPPQPEPEVDPVLHLTAEPGPDPAILALARLERFLSAIESLRA